MVVQLIYLLGLLLLALMALRSVGMLDRRHANSVVASKETGTLDGYLARIEALTAEGHDEFFVTATEQDGDRFVQVSAGRDSDRILRYQFSIPITDWSRGYAVRIEAEARHRGHFPVRQEAGPMTFLDIDFDTSGDHAVFARWVFSDVYRLPADARVEITWG